MRIILTLALTLLTLFACHSVDTETNSILQPCDPSAETSVYETIPTEALQQKLAEDWQLLVTLKRNNRSPEHFNVIDEDIDPFTEAYVAGKDFLFLVGKDRKVVKSYYYFDQPSPSEMPEFDQHGAALPGVSARQVWHWIDKTAWWFKWTKDHVSDKDSR